MGKTEGIWALMPLLLYQHLLAAHLNSYQMLKANSCETIVPASDSAPLESPAATQNIQKHPQLEKSSNIKGPRRSAENDESAVTR